MTSVDFTASISLTSQQREVDLQFAHSWGEDNFPPLKQANLQACPSLSICRSHVSHHRVRITGRLPGFLAAR